MGWCGGAGFAGVGAAVGVGAGVGAGANVARCCGGGCEYLMETEHGGPGVGSFKSVGQSPKEVLRE